MRAKATETNPTRPARIGIVTVGRSDFSILKPLAKELEKRPTLSAGLIIAGAHFDPQAGMTVENARDSALEIWAELPTPIHARTSTGMTQTVSDILLAFGRVLPTLNLDMVVILGDRYEAYAAGLACFLAGVPVAHISGGCVTHGAIDDVFRHSLTQLAHLHFCDLPEFGERLYRLGAAPECVFPAGALGVDGITDHTSADFETLAQTFASNFPTKPGYALVTLHAETYAPDSTSQMAHAMIAALEETGIEVLYTYPNADPGAEDIIQQINAAVQRNPHHSVVKNLGASNFYSAMTFASVMVGNSSAGIIEAASFACPVVNIGHRQEDRVAAGNVLHVAADQIAITQGIRDALGPQMADLLSILTNPYGDGAARVRIANVIEQTLHDGIIPKRFYDAKSAERGKPMFDVSSISQKGINNVSA